MKEEISFRSATPSDAPLIARFLKELALYENMLQGMRIDETKLALHLNIQRSGHLFEALIAEHRGVPVGIATYFMRYSTFTTSWALHLEDLYVVESHRSRGLGKAFLVVLARMAAKHGYTRLDLNVLGWNKSARALYEGLGAVALSEWVPMRLEGDALSFLAERPDIHDIVIAKEE